MTLNSCCFYYSLIRCPSGVLTSKFINSKYNSRIKMSVPCILLLCFFVCFYFQFNLLFVFWMTFYVLTFILVDYSSRRSFKILVTRDQGWISSGLWAFEILSVSFLVFAAGYVGWFCFFTCISVKTTLKH